ncbi:MAG: ATP-dependent DNA helicase, partial [Caulobacteraceae bacterium]
MSATLSAGKSPVAAPPATNADPPLALVVLPGGQAALAHGSWEREASAAEAKAALEAGSVLLVHAAMTFRRLALPPPPRSPRLLDVLELFAFVRPARFCAPSPAGVALAMGLPEPKGPIALAVALREVATGLITELADSPEPGRAEALALAETLGRAGWAWGPSAIAALRSVPIAKEWRSGGLDVWSRLAEWEDAAPTGPPGSTPVAPVAAELRLAALLARSGLDEARPAQAIYARETAHAFGPREREGAPMMVLAEAGTGIGKTLGYLAPASLWSEANGGAVWVSTYTRALQRQIERQSRAVYPDPASRARKAVVRKGRENYLCLLNYQEAVNAAQLGGGDVIGLALAARWIRASRDGDMTGGDFPAWLTGLFAVGALAQAGPLGLADRRGECIHAACPHYRACFIEKAVRASRGAELVIANHALVMHHAAFDASRAARRADDVESAQPLRIVFDEGHQLFDAADSAFAAVLSGAEAAELRRWVRGPESRGRRGRGLETRLSDMLADREAAREALASAIRASAALPGEGWPVRLVAGTANTLAGGPIEAFLAAVLTQVRARAAPSDASLECLARPALDDTRAAASAAARAISALETPLVLLAERLAQVLDDGADTLEGGEKARIAGALRGIERRARMTLPAWRAMLTDIAESAAADPDFIDWFEAVHAGGRLVDVAFRRHWVDPTEPLHAAVIAPAHGVLVTSATLADSSLTDPFALAAMRTGAARLVEGAKTVRLSSPFDYATQSLALVVTDVAKDDPRQAAAALRELFLAAGGGALGLFTAIRRLKAVHERIAAPLAQAGLALYAQHVDGLDAGALVDMFRAEEDSCLLGTDAVR